MLHALIQSPWLERTGWLLVHSLWQFALVALLAAVLQWLLRRRSATLRYGVLLAGMSIMVAMPAVTWLAIGPIERPVHAGFPASAGLPENSRLKAELQRPDFPPPESSDDLPGSVVPPRDGAKPQAAVISQDPQPHKPVAWWSKLKMRLEPWLPAIVLVWIAGVALFAFRPLASWYTVRRLRTVGVAPVADSIRGALRRTANQLRITRTVTILQSTLVKTPVVIGYLRPLILLPLCIVTGLPESQLELILAHELAHIRRHDYLINLVQTLIETLFFYHPAVWWLSRRIRHERENCCDDIALSLTANRADYGRALLAIEELRAVSPVLSVAAGGGSLVARIRRIAGLEPAPRAADGAILAAFLASMAILAAVTWAAAPAADKSSGSTLAVNPADTTGHASPKKSASNDKAIEERETNTKSASWGYRHRRTFLADGGQLNLVGLLVTNGYWRKSLLLAPAQATAITKLDDLIQQAFDNVCLDAADYMDTNPPDYQEYNARLEKRFYKAISRTERMVAVGLLTEPQAAFVMQRHLTNGSTGSRLYPLRDENVQELLGMTASQISGLDKVGAEANRREAPLNLWTTDPKEQQSVKLAMEANAKWLDEAAMNVLTPAQREIWSQVAAERHLPATPPDLPAPSAAEAARIKVDEVSPVFRALAEKPDDIKLSDKQQKLLDGLKEITREGLFWIGRGNSKNAGEFVKQAEQVALFGILTEKQAAMVAQLAQVDANASKPGSRTSANSASDAKPAEALTYTGTVVDKLTGKAIAGATVTVRRSVSSHKQFPSAKLSETKHECDGAGRYTFSVPRDQVAQPWLYLEFTVEHPNYVRYYGGYSFGMTRKNEKLGERPFFEKLALEPAEEVSGTVKTPDGKPAKGVLIKAVSLPVKNDLNETPWADTLTNDEGHFQFNASKRGDAIFWILPGNYAPSTHVLHAKRGDLGRFDLEKGLVLSGRVVDTDGKPQKNVWVNAEIRGGPAKQKIDVPVFDHLARSALSDEKGEFSMAPLPAGNYDLIMAAEPRGGPRGDIHPLPAVFINQEITLDRESSAKAIEIRAVPHVLIAGQYLDGSGKPTSGFAPHLSAHVPESHVWFWDTAQIDKNGKFTVKSPKGFVAYLDIADNEHHAIKARTSKNGPVKNGRTLDLGVLDRDLDEVSIFRYVAPILLVQATEEDGTPIRKFQPSIRYQFNGLQKGGQYVRDGRPAGDVGLERQDDGRWRTSQLLPDEEFTVTISAAGYESKSGKLKLSEGEVKELAVTLKPAGKANDPSGKTSAAKPADKASPDKDKPSEAEPSGQLEPPPGFLILPAYRELAGRERRQRYGIDAAQEKDLQNIAGAFQTATTKINEAYKESQNLSPQEKKAKIKELEADYLHADTEVRKRIGDVLTAQQKADYVRDVRYNSAIWFCGDPRAACMATGIELSQQQREQFNMLGKESREKYRGKPERIHDRLMAVLTPQQRERLLARITDADAATAVDVPPFDSSGIHILVTKLAPPPLRFSFLSDRMASVTVYPQLYDPSVRKHLALTADEEAKLQAVLVKSETAAQKIFDRFEPKTAAPKLSHEAQESQRAEYRRALEQFGKQVIAEIEEVLQPQQVAALKAIGKKSKVESMLWYHDHKALDDIHVTEEQRAKLWEIYRENAEPDVPSFRARGEKALGILTPEQRKKLDEALAR